MSREAGLLQLGYCHDWGAEDYAGHIHCVVSCLAGSRVGVNQASHLASGLFISI